MSTLDTAVTACYTGAMTNTFSDQDQISIAFSGAGVEVIAMTLEDLQADYPEMAEALAYVAQMRDLMGDLIQVTLRVAEWRILQDQLYRNRYDSPIAEKVESELAKNGWVD